MKTDTRRFRGRAGVATVAVLLLTTGKQAMQMAVNETNAWLAELRGLDFFRSFALSSIAVDFHVTQVVDETKGVHAMIPNKLGGTPPYWYKPKGRPL